MNPPEPPSPPIPKDSATLFNALPIPAVISFQVFITGLKVSPQSNPLKTEPIPSPKNLPRFSPNQAPSAAPIGPATAKPSTVPAPAPKPAPADLLIILFLSLLKLPSARPACTCSFDILFSSIKRAISSSFASIAPKPALRNDPSIGTLPSPALAFFIIPPVFDNTLLVVAAPPLRAPGVPLIKPPSPCKPLAEKFFKAGPIPFKKFPKEDRPLVKNCVIVLRLILLIDLSKLFIDLSIPCMAVEALPGNDFNSSGIP